MKAMAGAAVDVETHPATTDRKAFESWSDPVQMTMAAALPEFPLEALPADIAEFVRELAASLEVHPDMPAVFTLGVGAAACQGKYKIHVRADYREPLNLFVAVALPPAELKSATIREVVGPLLTYEAELQDREYENVVLAEERYLVAMKRREELRSLAAKAKDEGERIAASQELEALASLPNEKPTLPRLTASADILPEVLARLLNAHHGRLTLYDAEGGTLFGNLGGRYQGGTPNFEILLKAHAGDDVQVDRQSKPAIVVRHPCLTVMLAVQPDVIRRMTDTPSFRERGLAGRFLYSFPRPLAGRRAFSGTPIRGTTRARYTRLIRSALDRETANIDGQEVAYELTLAPDAMEIFLEMAVAIEAQMRDGGELHGLSDWAGKARGAAARLAGVLHVLTHAGHGSNSLNSLNSLRDGEPGETQDAKASAAGSSCPCRGRPESVLISAGTVVAACCDGLPSPYIRGSAARGTRLDWVLFFAIGKRFSSSGHPSDPCRRAAKIL
jgi:hypothetical protein